MQQLKFFKGLETDLEALEDEINKWIRDAKVRIVNIFGNLSPQSMTGEGTRNLSRPGFASSDVLLVIVYELPAGPK